MIRTLGVLLLLAALAALLAVTPVMWNDALAIDRISDVLADGALGVLVSAVLALGGTWLLYRTAATDVARLSLLLGVGCGFATVALLISSASSGFFAGTYNPLGILLVVLGTLGTVLGVVKSFGVR